MPAIPAPSLQRLATLVLRQLGCEAGEAEMVAKHLVRANLTGHDSHGIGVLPSYAGHCRDGLIVPNQTLRLLMDEGALVLFDAGRGFGQRMAEEAVRAAMQRAAALGACVMGMRNSSHIGRVGGYAEIAAAGGMAFIAFVNVADFAWCQAPWGTSEAKLGTNPFCAAVPGGAADPALLLDFATTTIAYNKARIALDAGRPVPEGTLIDAEGHPTTDPADFIQNHRGALTAFGKHKGSGLAVLCEALGGVLTGGQRADEPQRGSVLNSLLAIVIDTGRFVDAAILAAGLGAVAESIHGARPAPGVSDILLPGEPERRAATARGAEGVDVSDAEWARLLDLARELGVAAAVLDELAATAR
jgi:uncharacterized oxidoreductase